MTLKRLLATMSSLALAIAPAAAQAPQLPAVVTTTPTTNTQPADL